MLVLELIDVGTGILSLTADMQNHKGTLSSIRKGGLHNFVDYHFVEFGLPRRLMRRTYTAVHVHVRHAYMSPGPCLLGTFSRSCAAEIKELHAA